jgi:hypothetical protein
MGGGSEVNCLPIASLTTEIRSHQPSASQCSNIFIFSDYISHQNSLSIIVIINALNNYKFVLHYNKNEMFNLWSNTSIHAPRRSE